MQKSLNLLNEKTTFTLKLIIAQLLENQKIR